MHLYVSYLLKVGFALAILVFIFSSISLGDVALALVSADVVLVCGALVAAAVQVFVTAARFKLITDWQGMSLSLPLIARVNLIALFYGLLLPGEVASNAVRWHRFNQVERKGAQVLAAIVFGRLVFSAVLIATAIVFLLLDATARAQGGGIIFAMGVLLLGLLGAALLACHPAVLRRGLALGRRLPIPAPIWRITEKLASAAEQYHELPRRTLGNAVVLSFAETLLGVVGLVLMARALDIDVAIATLGWLRSVVQIVSMVPITIAGLGVREGSLIVLLEPYGVAASAAVALSFLLLARMLLLAAAGGVFEAVRWLGPRAQTRAATVLAEPEPAKTGTPTGVLLGAMRTWRNLRAGVSAHPPD